VKGGTNHQGAKIAKKTKGRERKEKARAIDAPPDYSLSVFSLLGVLGALAVRFL
jgi:hypothetical protein